MDPKRPGCESPPCTLHPSNEPGFVPLPIFLPCDSPTSWDLCTSILAAENLDSWQNSLLWDRGSLVIPNSSQEHLNTLGAGSIYPRSPLDPSRSSLAQPWDGLSLDIPIDTSPDFVQLPVTAAHPVTGAPCPMSKMNPDLDEVLAHVSHILSCHPKGMRVKRLVKALLKECGVDLWAFSQDDGYRGIVSFLREVPGVQLWKPEKGEKCHVLSCTFKKDVADPLPLLCSTLGSFPHGLRVFSLRKAMWQRHGVDLEEFSQQRGYLGTLDYLTRLPEVRLQGLERGDKCLVLLQTGAAVKPPILKLSPDPALPSALDSSAPQSNAPADPSPPPNVRPMEATSQAPSLAEVSSWVQEVLGRFPMGLKVGKLKKMLQREHWLDLEVLSCQHGYEDALSLLQVLPQLRLQDLGKGNSCLAQLATEAAVDPADLLGQKQHRCLVADAATMALLIQDALASHPQGMRVKKLREALEEKYGVDLEAFSLARGYKDLASFLSDIPELMLWAPKKGNNYHVQIYKGVSEKPPTPQLPPDPVLPLALDSSTPQSDAPADPSPPANMEPMVAVGQAPSLAKVSSWVQEVLSRFPMGLKVGKLKKVLRREHWLDLEVLSYQHGYGDALGLLGGLPHLRLQALGKGDSCLVQLHTGAAIIPTKPAGRKQHRCLVADAGTMALLIQDILALLPQGLQVKKLMEALEGKHGVDLEAFSRAKGHEDVVSFLGTIPRLLLRAPERGSNCFVHLRRGVTEILGLLKHLLRTYRTGLRLKKVQELLQEKHGLDLEEIANSQGYEDMLAFLQSCLPALEYTRPEKGKNCIIRLGTEWKGSSGSLPPGSAQPLPSSRRCLLPANAPERPASPATSCLNPLLPSATTNRPLLPGLPSGQEPLCAPVILGKLRKSPAANPCLPAWLLSPPQPSSACSSLQVDNGIQESGARHATTPLVLRAEEGNQESGAQLGSPPPSSWAGSSEAPTLQSPEDLVELKQKVGGVLARHPKGMSLFQFRAAYSATYQHPLPLGRTASTKQWLAQMPDVVRIQGFGVQTLLLPVGPDGPPGPEPGLTRWIPQEAAALAHDPSTPAELPPKVPKGPDLTGDPHTEAKTLPAPADAALTGAPDALVKPPPAPAGHPNVLAKLSPGPALPGDPHVLAEACSAPSVPALAGALDALVKLPPTPAEDPKAQVKPTPVPADPAFVGEAHIPTEPHPALTKIPPIPQTLLHPEAARPEVSWEVPGLVPTIPGAPSRSARPVLYPEPPSQHPLGLDPSLTRHKMVQLVSPFQGHPWAGDASCITPQVQLLPGTLDQNQDTPAAVGPFPAMQGPGLNVAQGQALSTKPLPFVFPSPLPAPDASVSGTPTPSTEGWPQIRRPELGGDVGSPFKPLLHRSPDQPIPTAGRTQPDLGVGSLSAPQAPSPERFSDNCTIL